MKNLILAFSILFLGACAMKQKVMDVSVVSNTHAYLPEGSKLQEMGPVAGNFCADSFGDKGSIGLFDQAINSAQTQSHADFITNASFFREGSCISLEGTGQRLVSSAGGAPMAPQTPSAIKKSPKHKK